jgi:hypothetical protein
MNKQVWGHPYLGSLSHWLCRSGILLHRRQNLVRQDIMDLGKVFVDVLRSKLVAKQRKDELKVPAA